MGLSMHDRQVLADIEQHLTEHDPRLASLLSDFGEQRTRVRGTAGALWRGTAVVAAGVALLLGTVLLAVAVAVHGEALTIAGSLTLVTALTLGAAAFSGRLRRRRGG
ncbi:DUF3040 domain-containing protein [Streptomyces sp. NPDC092296]|uniref:DUF3040 domain-containing protein n=1 Tax=Streptomyces sp. NPDC092296 TaxID=3366012 RepID=UPI003828A9D4